jgi:hypothetical protein
MPAFDIAFWRKQGSSAIFAAVGAYRTGTKSFAETSNQR